MTTVTPVPVIYSDDTDAYWTFTVYSRDSTNVDWPSPVVAVANGSYSVSATFLGSPATTRQIKVPLVGMAVGDYQLYLKVPNGTDIELGRVIVKARS